MADIDGDSPLSIILSIAGIFTFLTAVIATAWLRFNAVRKAEKEIKAFMETMKTYERERDRLEHMYEFKYRVNIRCNALPSIKSQEFELVPVSPFSLADEEQNYPIHTSLEIAETGELDLKFHRLLVEAFLGDIDLGYFLKCHYNGDWDCEPHKAGEGKRSNLFARYPTVRHLNWDGNMRPTQGYTVRWIRMRSQVEELKRRREALAKTRVLNMLSNQESYMKKNRARSKRQQQVIERQQDMIHAQQEMIRD